MNRTEDAFRGEAYNSDNPLIESQSCNPGRPALESVRREPDDLPVDPRIPPARPPSHPPMNTIHGDVLIRRPPSVVADYVTTPKTAPKPTPKMMNVNQTTRVRQTKVPITRTMIEVMVIALPRRPAPILL